MGLTREQLYEEVWAEPMLKVAERHGTFSTVVARACDRLNVPRPPQGYWLKTAEKRAQEKPPLPAALPGDETEWVRGGYGKGAVPLEAPVTKSRRTKGQPTEHPLVAAARVAFLQTKVSEAGYLRPMKKALVDVFVSQGTLDRALSTLNALFLLLERRGHRVVLAPRDVTYYRRTSEHRERKGQDLYSSETWRPDRPTLVFVSGVAYGLYLFEIADAIECKYVGGKYIPVADVPPPKRRQWVPDHEWKTTRDLPSGRFGLFLYGPYRVADWSREWREKSAGTLTRSFREIVRVVEGETTKMRELVAEGLRQEEEQRKKWEEERRQWQREEEERRRKKALADSREQFLSIVESWARARNLEAFFADAQQRLERLPAEEQVEIRGRLSRARELFGGTDALGHFSRWVGPEER